MQKVSKSRFLYSLFVAAIVVILINATVVFFTRNSVPRRVMAHARQRPSAEVAAIGNSLIVTGFDEPAFDAAMNLDEEKGSVNLGLGASSPVEQLLLLRYALSQGMRPRMLIYGFYDLQLSTPVEFETREIIGNHAMLYYLEPEYGRAFYRLSFRDGVEFEVMRHFPMMTERGAIWAKVEKMRRKMAELGLPKEQTNRFGRVQDFSLLEAANTSEFIKQCDSASQRGLVQPVRELIRAATQGGMKVVFVEMPMSPAHVRSYYETSSWDYYRSHIRTLVSAQSVKYIDASHWFADEELFADHLHLSEAGAKQFSERLGKLLTLDQEVRAAELGRPRPSASNSANSASINSSLIF